MHSPARTLFQVACLVLAGGEGVAQASSRVQLSHPSSGLADMARATVEQNPAGPAIPVELPDGEVITVHFSTFERTIMGGSTARGPVGSHPLDYAAFAIHGAALRGVIHYRGELYRARGVRGIGDGFVLVKESPSSFPSCGLTPDDADSTLPNTLTNPPPGPQKRTVLGPSRATTPGPLRPTFSRAAPTGIGDTIVDILVTWTPESRVAAGGTESILAIIDLAVLEANVAYDSSEVDLFLRLVLAVENAYIESGSQAVDLARLRGQGDPYLEMVHTLRDTYGADAVSMIVKDNTRCGRSYNMSTTPPANFGGSAFNLVAQDCATGEYAFAHEFGHNFGLDHDRPNTANIPSYPYAYGFWLSDNEHRTIMALRREGIEGTRIPFYSNPNLTYLGLPLGIADPSPQSSDCTRALNLNAPFIAAWRSTVVP